MELYLREPTEDDKDEMFKLCHEFETCDDPYPFEGCLQIKAVLVYSFEDWLRACRLDKKMDKLYTEGINTINYLLVDETNHIYGCSQFRPELKESIMNIGGNISYAIRPSERGKGYGVYQLKLLVEKAKEIGLEKVLVTCRENNEKSIKVIKRLKGVEDVSAPSRFPDIMEKRFWIYIR